MGYFSPHFFRYYNQIIISRKCKSKGYVVLTYDDGPNPETTNYVLDLLNKNRIKATFFILGEKVAANTEIIQRMIISGHEIGCHGFEHVNAWKTTPWRAINDIKNGKSALLNMGITCTLYRPPYGKLTLFTWFYALALRMRGAWWTIASGDTYRVLPQPESFVDKVINRGGGVILMHDFHRTNERRNFVLSVTEMLIEKSKKNGLKIKTLGEIL